MMALAFVGTAAAATLLRWQGTLRLGRASGTLIVNLAGSFVLGVLVGAGTTPTVVFQLAGLGSLTTFSTLMIEVLDRFTTSRAAAATYLAATFVGSIALAWCGIRLGTS